MRDTTVSPACGDRAAGAMTNAGIVKKHPCDASWNEVYKMSERPDPGKGLACCSKGGSCRQIPKEHKGAGTLPGG